MSNSKDIDLDSFFSNFKSDLDKKVEENNEKIATQIKEAKVKAIDEIENIDTPLTDSSVEVEIKQEDVGEIKPIIVELPAIYNSTEKSLSEDAHISDHLSQHWGF